MVDDTAVQLVRDALEITLKVAAPVLVAGMLIGLLISIVQAVTSIQDQTLQAVPKIAAMLVVGLVLLPWMVMRLVQFAADMFVLF
jgi:flagellar biosynthetic protein FliQ